MPDKVFPIKLVDRTGEQIEVGILYENKDFPYTDVSSAFDTDVSARK